MPDRGADPRVSEGAAQACHQRRHLRRRDPRRDDPELVAAEPGHDVVVPQLRAQHLGGTSDQRVAGRVSRRVVDGLEAIEVKHDHCRRVTERAQALLLDSDQAVPAPAVAQPGEGVGLRLPLRPLGRTLRLRAREIGLQDRRQEGAEQSQQGLLPRQSLVLGVGVEPAQRAEHLTVVALERDADVGPDAELPGDLSLEVLRHGSDVGSDLRGSRDHAAAQGALPGVGVPRSGAVGVVAHLQVHLALPVVPAHRPVAEGDRVLEVVDDRGARPVERRRGRQEGIGHGSRQRTGGHGTPRSPGGAPRAPLPHHIGASRLPV